MFIIIIRYDDRKMKGTLHLQITCACDHVRTYKFLSTRILTNYRKIFKNKCLSSYQRR